MAISIVVLLANIYLFNTAHRNLAHARSITDATNLATGKIADFRAMTIEEINLATTVNTAGRCWSARAASTSWTAAMYFTC